MPYLYQQAGLRPHECYSVQMMVPSHIATVACVPSNSSTVAGAASALTGLTQLHQLPDYPYYPNGKKAPVSSGGTVIYCLYPCQSWNIVYKLPPTGPVHAPGIKPHMRIIHLLLALLASTGAYADSINVTDATGSNVILDSPARRIVSLAPHITENLFAAGAGSSLVGVVEYSDYPDAARSITSVGAYNNFDLELIFSLQPDLVIAWREGNQKQQVERLQALGLKVYIDGSEDIPDIAESLVNFGILTGNESAARHAATRFNAKLQQITERNASSRKLKVFYQTWNKPLITVNNEQLIGRVIAICGGDNVFGKLDSLSPKVSIESVIQHNPEVIVTSGMGLARPEWLDDWRNWPFIDAVKYNNLFFIPPDIIQRHTPRILEGAELLCGQLATARTKLEKRDE